MNRSIFPIYLIFKNFNSNLFLINFTFALLVYFFGALHGGFVNCDELFRLLYNNINIRHNFTSSSTRLYDSIDFFYNYISNTPQDNFKFRINRYLQLDGTRFKKTHPLDHFHLNFYVENMYNVHYNLQFTTKNPIKLGLLPHEYEIFNKITFKGIKQPYYVFKDLRVYNLDALKFLELDNKEYLKIYRDRSIYFFKDAVKAYKK